MKPDDYLAAVLKEQALADSDPEMQELRKHGEAVDRLLRARFADARPVIRWAGSKAKGTMIREAHDGDRTCYIPHDAIEAGETLEDIYNNAAAALAPEYLVERRTSALRIRDRSTEGFQRDHRIDVVVGRFIDDTRTDLFLHQENSDKDRLKTNPDIHIQHIRSSGLLDEIMLAKLWRTRNGLTVKTFVLELLVIDLLKKSAAPGLAARLEHVLTEFRDHAEYLAVEDPANPTGNDLAPVLNACRHHLSAVARTTLASIVVSGWEGVFGALTAAESRENNRAAIRVAVGRVATPTKPWYRSA